MPHMVDIAQSVEQLIVVQQVARSSRVIHPITPRKRGFSFFTSMRRRVAVLPGLTLGGDTLHLDYRITPHHEEGTDHAVL